MKKNIRIGTRIISENHPALIIAEIGINHQGDVNIAKEMIKTAKECGVDAVKFQKRTTNKVLTKKALQRNYENRNSFGKTYGEHREALELSYEEYYVLKEYADNIGILFSASGWDAESVDFLDKLGVPFFKVASGDLTNLPLVEHTARKNKPLILSTGMADIETIKKVYETTVKINDSVAIMHCTSSYPTPFNEINLNVLSTFQKEFPKVIIGYSGHELGIAIPPVAVALGAKIIERHFTLDRTMRGGDHAASLEPQGLSKMVRDIRHIEEAMGSFEKRIQASELSVKKKLTKSIVASRDIKRGESITADMIITKSPGEGISPLRITEIIGKQAKNDIENDTVIYESDIKW